MFEFNSETNNSQAQIATRCMENFVEGLHSFINTTGFAFDNFGSQVESLGVQLANITTFVDNVSPCKELSTQLTFTRDLFESMLEAVHSWERFKSLGVPVFAWFPDVAIE